MSKDLTVAQLEKLLLKKKTKLEGLVQKRENLQKRLSQVEGRILEIGGVTRERRKARKGRRPKNTKKLVEVVSDILSQHKKGLTLKDLADKILASGYKTASTNFPNTLYQCLYLNSDKLVHDDKTHTYRLK